jgi:hypothetical protein
VIIAFLMLMEEGMGSDSGGGAMGRVEAELFLSLILREALTLLGDPSCKASQQH